MRHWCISTSQQNWQICKQNLLWGMDARYFITWRDFLLPGDLAVVYNHGGFFPAVIKFTENRHFSMVPLGWVINGQNRILPYRSSFEILCESKKPPHIRYSTDGIDAPAQIVHPNLIDDITFIADKGRTWNQYVQVSIIRITEEDFNTISNAICHL